MKNLKKMLAVLVVISMISTFFVPALAAEDSYTYEAEAEKLYELGLYKGTSTTVYEPNLGGKLDRQTGLLCSLDCLVKKKKHCKWQLKMLLLS